MEIHILPGEACTAYFCTINLSVQEIHWVKLLHDHRLSMKIGNCKDWILGFQPTNVAYFSSVFPTKF